MEKLLFLILTTTLVSASSYSQSNCILVNELTYMQQNKRVRELYNAVILNFNSYRILQRFDTSEGIKMGDAFISNSNNLNSEINNLVNIGPFEVCFKKVDISEFNFEGYTAYEFHISTPIKQTDNDFLYDYKKEYKGVVRLYTPMNKFDILGKVTQSSGIVILQDTNFSSDFSCRFLSGDLFLDDCKLILLKQPITEQKIRDYFKFRFFNYSPKEITYKKIEKENVIEFISNDTFDKTNRYRVKLRIDGKIITETIELIK